MINCPNCGELTTNDVEVYNESLRKQNLSISPILPLCKKCRTEVIITNKCNSGNIIVLNGTSGSGKSSIAEILANKGYLAIDSDCAIQVIRHKKRVKQL